MFPILKSTNRVITRGYYFPYYDPTKRFFYQTSLYIVGSYKHPIVTMNKNGKILFSTDRGVEILFPVDGFDLTHTTETLIKFRTPDGNILEKKGIVSDSKTLS